MSNGQNNKLKKYNWIFSDNILSSNLKDESELQHYHNKRRITKTYVYTMHYTHLCTHIHTHPRTYTNTGHFHGDDPVYCSTSASG